MSNATPEKLQVGAVSFLNTVPLIYGMTHGAQTDAVDITFSLPSVCAQQLEAGSVQVGIVPTAEIARQRLEIVSDVGIGAFGAVRSILLFSKVPWRQVRTLAADSASRTSVQLARVVLQEQFGVSPSVLQFEANLSAMLRAADSALIIGDPALRIDPTKQSFEWLDLGAEWLSMTHLPFVFAAWAAKSTTHAAQVRRLTMASYQFGKDHLSEIVDDEFPRRGISRELADQYLRSHLRYELGPAEWKGMELFLSLAGSGRVAV